MFNNLKYINKTEEWLRRELKVRGYKELSNILLVTVDNDDKLTIYEKNQNVDSFDLLE